MAVAALACGIALVDAVPGRAGTVIRGRVQLPPTALTTRFDGHRSRETLDARDAVVYVTEAPGGKGRLGGRPGRREVDLEADHFTPRVLPVMVGSRVRLRNHDHVYHSPFSISAAGRLDLGDLTPGATREVRFDRPGVVNLFCELHPSAAGFVIVCPNWFFARAAASGDYVLPPLPRGSYIVHAWHPRLGAFHRPVETTGRGLITLDLRR